MNDLHDLTVAIVPIDGGELTMSTEEAIALINRLQPEYAIPVHYSIGSMAPEDFRSGVRGKTKVQIMDGQEPLVAMTRK
jgi:L-ascorbate metabolism protein UlaG (beta-lactamase superfamily)